MYSTLVALALLAAPALAQFSIDTPVFTQCKDVTINWSNGKGPYNVIITKEEDPCGDALADLGGDLKDTKLNWKVALPAGQKVQLSVEDINGDEAWSGVITVAGSDDKTCLSNKATVQAAGAGETKPGGSGSNSNGSGAASVAVVTPTTTVNVAATTPTVTSGSNGGLAGAVGGVGNAGANPLGLGSNGALTMRQASTPVMVLGAFAAILVASL